MATASKKAKATEIDANQPVGYCMKTKEKNVPIQDCTIDIVNGKYIAKGHDGKDNKITTIMGAAKAEAAIEAGLAAKGNGWSKVAGKKK